MKPKSDGITPDSVLRDIRQLYLAYKAQQPHLNIDRDRIAFYLNPLAYDTLMQHEIVTTSNVVSHDLRSVVASVYGIRIECVPDQSPELGNEMITLRETARN